MFCIRNIQRTCINTPVRIISKAKYSRRSDRNTSSYKPVQSKDDAFDDLEHIFGVNPNWELLTPRGFRFYLPGSIGPGWLDASTTAQVEVHSIVVPNEIEDAQIANARRTNELEFSESPGGILSVLHCSAQECPTLLRKGIIELFPGCFEVTSPQLTIVTISQKTKDKTSRWSLEIETEKLAQYFVLAASDICKKLKMCGYWADFINPFSGQPYLNPHKNGILYKTDERFRCLGFKVEQKTNCKVISPDADSKNFIGNLYTTAPSSTEFLKEIMNNLNSKLN
ncbi:hypothetical protein QAD02_023813 [Eretmocerus hayati]|uniref:Uncharacterized protein n=1 Tax=Eretmocerus hayati TaxID=131215 RepID=A0ACC2PYI7_9HYME|nr:hypothetical protein QAD02_023813 [Eretmocerus hayati]